MLAACSSIDCPLLNSVSTHFVLKGDVTKLTDTLTVAIFRHDGTDSVMLNRSVNTSSFLLPASYTADKDELHFAITDEERNTYLDTVVISKTNTPHFESVDCSPQYFHKITGVEYTRNAIDSIVINKTDVDYDTTKVHFHIYFTPRQ